MAGTFIRKPIFPNGLSLSSIARHISSKTYQLDPYRATGNKTWFYQKLWARLVYDVKYRTAKVKGLILYVALQRTTSYETDTFLSGLQGSNMSLTNVLRFTGGTGV
jgi:hypothetical protein